MSELIEILAPIFVLIILGFLSVKLRFLSSDDYPVLSSFVMKVAFPCLLLTKLSVLDLSKHFRWDILIIFLVCSLALAIVSISFSTVSYDAVIPYPSLREVLGRP